MSKGNFDPCFAFTIGAEGKYSTNRSDHGNWSSGKVGVGHFVGSCWGISAPVLNQWVGIKNTATVTADYMRNLSIVTAKAIYLSYYWNAIRGDDLPIGVDLVVWDFAVNAGVSRSVKELQTILGVEVDGALGSKTLSGIEVVFNGDTAALIEALIDYHKDFYRSDPDFQEFGEGWLARQDRVAASAATMITSN
jgi:lysozyme family protein